MSPFSRLQKGTCPPRGGRKRIVLADGAGLERGSEL
ncbi:MAG: hypothetical protein JWO34_141, partial [Arthrobacter sp.]|nr:hypothetical protein [Arthrobacter sp.]